MPTIPFGRAPSFDPQFGLCQTAVLAVRSVCLFRFRFRFGFGVVFPTHTQNFRLHKFDLLINYTLLFRKNEIQFYFRLFTCRWVRAAKPVAIRALKSTQNWISNVYLGTYICFSVNWCSNLKWIECLFVKQTCGNIYLLFSSPPKSRSLKNHFIFPSHMHKSMQRQRNACT